MSDNKKVVVKYPICGVLFIVFLVLKLTNTIDWSLWWVTAPLWVPICGVVRIVLLAIIIMGIVGILNLKDI